MDSTDGSRDTRVPAAPRGRATIAARLRWSCLISSTLPLLIVGALLLWISWTTQKSNVYANQRELAARVSRNVSTYINRLARQLDTYALSVRPTSTSLAQWKLGAQDIATRNYPDMISLTLLDRNGAELLRVANLQLLADDQLRQRGDEPAIRRALREGAQTFSPISHGIGQTASFTITMPLPNDAGAVIGALEAQLSAEPIAEELRLATAGTSSRAYLVQPESGALILGDGAGGASSASLARLLQTRDGAAEYVGVGGQPVIGAIAPVSLSSGPGSSSVGWSVVVEQPASVGFANLRGQILILGLLIVLVGSLALLWAFRSAGQFLRPLAEVRAGAAAIGAGRLDYRIPVYGDDELGQVAITFNQMADHLQESLAEIEDQNERLRHGLTLARDIQVGLLPDRAPWPEDSIEVYARSIPAYEVGGDFYTYMALPNSRAAVAIGDISGKGVGAALLMALTASTVESQARQFDHPAAVLTALNQLLAPRMKANHMNAALLFAIFDPVERTLRVANAGMIAPVLVSPRGNRFIEIGGLPVGAFAGAVYQDEVVRLEPEDAVLLLSDGVVEAHDAQGNLFGFERLAETVTAAQPAGSVQALVEHVLDEVHAFMGATEQHDDITLVAIRMGALVERADGQREQAVDYATV